MDVFRDLLQRREVLDVLNLVAGLFQQSLVDDDAERLVAVADGLQLALCIVEVEGVGVELLGDGAVGQIQCVFVPVVQSGGVADVEDGDVADVGSQGVVVVAGSSGNDLNFDTGLLGVGRSQLGQGFVELRLEVQVVNGTLRGIGVVFGRGGLGRGLAGIIGRSGLFVALAAGEQAGDHCQSQKQCKQFFHFLSS